MLRRDAWEAKERDWTGEERGERVFALVFGRGIVSGGGEGVSEQGIDRVLRKSVGVEVLCNAECRLENVRLKDLQLHGFRDGRIISSFGGACLIDFL